MNKQSNYFNTVRTWIEVLKNNSKGVPSAFV